MVRPFPIKKGRKITTYDAIRGFHEEKVEVGPSFFLALRTCWPGGHFGQRVDNVNRSSHNLHCGCATATRASGQACHMKKTT